MKMINDHLDFTSENKYADNKVIGLLTKTNTNLISICLLLLRCTVGVILFIAGSGKVFGWFGGFGMDVTLQGYAQMGFAHSLTYLSMFTELVGGFLFVIGFFTRPVAIAVIINMLVATIIMLPNGFLGPSGASYPFIFLIISVVVFFAGPMSLSIDSLMLKKIKFISSNLI